MGKYSMLRACCPFSKCCDWREIPSPEEVREYKRKKEEDKEEERKKEARLKLTPENIERIIKELMKKGQ